MLTYFSNLLLGAVGRATGMVLDAEMRVVMLDHWRLDWRRLPDALPGARRMALSSLG